VATRTEVAMATRTAVAMATRTAVAMATRTAVSNPVVQRGWILYCRFRQIISFSAGH
jgi:hypothetical protein